MDRFTRLDSRLARQVLHIDFDSFFASVEQQYNPLLRGKPVGVTATNGRTCIIASSREAKRLGIKTGTRTYEARRLCPSIIFVSADFVKYFEVSKKFLNICKDYSAFVELFSIDELFIDITSTQHLFGGAYSIVSKIKKQIREEIGEYITVSVGISYNKLLAKLASGIRKPDGVFEIGKNDVESVYQKAELTDMCGIGERIKARLNTIGIYTLMQLRKAPLEALIEEFGNIEGHFLKDIGLGIDASSVIPYSQAPEVKSVGRNYCLPKNEYDKRVVLQNLFELCEEVGIKLRRLNKKARTIGVSLRGNINVGGRETYSVYMDRGSEIFRSCLAIVQEHFFPCHPERSEGSPEFIKSIEILRYAQNDNMKYVRQISVWVSNLENKENIQQSLFDSARQNSLQKTIDEINERFGDHTIRNGFLLYADKLTTVPNGYMADKYERTKLSYESNF
jgi:DNA polymerase-4